MPGAPQLLESIEMHLEYQITTKSEKSTPLPQGTADLFALAELGPYVPRLESIRTTIQAFSTVVDYCLYLLHDRNAVPTAGDVKMMDKMKNNLEDMHAIFDLIDGSKLIKLLNILSKLKKGEDAFSKSKPVAVSLLSYNLQGVPWDAKLSQVFPASRKRMYLIFGTWPFVFDALILRFLSLRVLRVARDEVVSFRQKEEENEGNCINSVESPAQASHYVLDAVYVSSYVASGLKEQLAWEFRSIKGCILKEYATLPQWESWSNPKDARG